MQQPYLGVRKKPQFPHLDPNSPTYQASSKVQKVTSVFLENQEVIFFKVPRTLSRHNQNIALVVLNQERCKFAGD